MSSEKWLGKVRAGAKGLAVALIVVVLGPVRAAWSQYYIFDQVTLAQEDPDCDGNSEILRRTVFIETNSAAIAAAMAEGRKPDQEYPGEGGYFTLIYEDTWDLCDEGTPTREELVDAGAEILGYALGWPRESTANIFRSLLGSGGHVSDVVICGVNEPVTSGSVTIESPPVTVQFAVNETMAPVLCPQSPNIGNEGGAGGASGGGSETGGTGGSSPGSTGGTTGGGQGGTDGTAGGSGSGGSEGRSSDGSTSGGIATGGDSTVSGGSSTTVSSSSGSEPRTKKSKRRPRRHAPRRHAPSHH